MMKFCLAAITLAACFAAAPASAQIAYGSTAPAVGALEGVDDGPDVYWKQNFAIYSTGGAVAPTSNAGTSGSTVVVPLAVWATGPQNGGLNVAAIGAAANAVTPVPEPATWAMMLIGFAAVGGALRSRRTVAIRYV